MVSMNYFDKIVVKTKTLTLNRRDKYYLNGMYKQIKEGDASLDSSNITDSEELNEWNEWNKLRGINQELIMNKYCDYFTHITNLQERNIYKYD